MTTQANADNSIMDGDEWQAMSEEHQASQLAAESKLANFLELVKDVPYLTKDEVAIAMRTKVVRGGK